VKKTGSIGFVGKGKGTAEVPGFVQKKMERASQENLTRTTGAKGRRNPALDPGGLGRGVGPEEWETERG